MRNALKRFGPPVALYLGTLIGENRLSSPSYAWVWDWLPWIAVVWGALAAISYSDRLWAILFGRLPHLRLEWKTAGRPQKAPQVDLIEEGRQRQARDQIRRHVFDLTQKYLLPSHEALDKALRAGVGQLAPARLVTDLIGAYDVLISDGYAELGNLTVMANRSLQDAPEESKPTIETLVEALAIAAGKHFIYCRLLDQLRLHPCILLHPMPEIARWKDARERLKDQLRQTIHVDGFGLLRRVSGDLRPSSIPHTAPKIVPSRYGHQSLKPNEIGDEGLFVENLGGAARGVVVQPFRLGRRVVKFEGPELPQLKREDGERFWAVGVEWPPHSVQTDLFHPFREWQQEHENMSLEMVGIITYADFDGNRYETHYRIGVDVHNTDGGMVVEFLEQRWI